VNKKQLFTLIKIVISLSLLLFFFQKIGLLRFAELIASVESTWIIIALAVLTISNFMGVYQWQLLLHSSGIDISYRRAISYYYTGLFFNNFLPSFIAGDIFRIYDVTKFSGKNSIAISTVFLDRLLGFVAIAFLALIFGVIHCHSLDTRIVIIPIVGFFIILIVIAVLFYNKKFVKQFEPFAKSVLPVVITSKIREVYNGINYFRNHKRLVSRLLVFSIIIQTFRIYTHYYCALALHIDDIVPVPANYFFIFIPLISFLSLIPISIGGIGVRESLGVFFFRFIGFPQEQAFLMEFLAYIIGILASLPGMIAFLIRKHTIEYKRETR